MQQILVPAHFYATLQERAIDLPIQLVPYDPEGRALVDTDEVVGIFRWWLSVERGDEIIREHPQLRWIHSGSAGVDHILTDTFLSRAITLTNSSGVHAPSIAEWVVAAMLYIEKDLGAMVEQQRERAWEKVERDELSTKRVTIVGAGAIATQIARRLRAFECHLTAVRRSSAAHDAFDETVAIDSLHEAVRQADWLIIAIPLSVQTRGLIDGRVLSEMKRTARLVNVARGEIVDEHALADALRSGAIAGAVLDVVTTEPPPPDHPLWDAPGTLLLPHTTWRSPQVKERQLELFLDNLQRFVRGEELRNVVNVERGY